MKNGTDCIGLWEPKLPGALHPGDRTAGYIVEQHSRSSGGAYAARTELARYRTREECEAAIAAIPPQPDVTHAVVRVAR